MSGYVNGNTFKDGIDNVRNLVPCMSKIKEFGFTGCPHCQKANYIYEQARAGVSGFTEEAGSAIYNKKLFLSLGIVQFPGKPMHGSIALVQWPTDRAKEIVEGVTNSDARLRWPLIDDIDDGRVLVLSKFKKDEKYSTYKVQLIQQSSVIDRAWWDSVKGGLPNMNDPASVIMAMNSWGKENKLVPAKDMENGNNVDIRVLPNTANVGTAKYIPFCMLQVHYVDVLTEWDKAWMSVNYDVSRGAEVVAMAGNMDSYIYAGSTTHPQKSGAAAPSAYVNSLMAGAGGMDNLPSGF